MNVSEVVSDPSCTYIKVPLEFKVKVPNVGGLTKIAVRESPFASVSFESNVLEPEAVIVTVAASFTLIESLTVTGGSPIVNVAELEIEEAPPQSLLNMTRY